MSKSNNRIHSIDLLRGFAVLGILIMNITNFSQVNIAYMNPTIGAGLEGYNQYFHSFNYIFADTRFMSIFSILFGAGVVLFTRNAETKGKLAGLLHYKRMFWLLLFGFVHAYFIWPGDILVSYAPEREDPGNNNFALADIPKVLAGFDAASQEAASAVYRLISPSIREVSSLETAEAVKITENVFRAVNIALVNELKHIYGKMGVDIFEVVDAAATKPFGYMPFRPGPGLGGHCIPIDPFYLSWKAREFGKNTRFIELAGEINTNMPDYVVSKVADALNDQGKALRNSKILVLGLAYKANVDDCRESPTFVLLEKLEAKGAVVEYHDSYVPVVPPTREHAHFNGKKSVLIEDSYDLILLSTDHSEYKKFDFSNFLCPLVDTRNCIKKRPHKYYQA